MTKHFVGQLAIILVENAVKFYSFSGCLDRIIIVTLKKQHSLGEPSLRYSVHLPSQ